MEEGRGFIKFADKTVYLGEFLNGFPEGKGLFKGRGGMELDGIFSEGRLHGEGTITYNDSQCYQNTEIKDDESPSLSRIQNIHVNHKINNQVLTKKNRIIGKEENIQLEKEKPTEVFSKKKSFTGEFKQGLPNGLGKFKIESLGEIVGHWEDGELNFLDFYSFFR